MASTRRLTKRFNSTQSNQVKKSITQKPSSTVALRKSMVMNNRDHSKEFIATVLHDENSILTGLRQDLKELAGDFQALQNLFGNLEQIEKNAIPQLRLKQSREEAYYNHPMLDEILDRSKGINIFKREVYNAIKNHRNDYYLQLLQEYQQQSPDNLLKLINNPSKRPRADLNDCEKLKLDTEVLALTQALHNSFSFVAVANRGIVAKKVLKKAREQGYRTILIAEESERYSLAAEYADHFIKIENPMDEQEIMEKLQRFKLNLPEGIKIAIHPGYGYLSEESRFPKACEENGHVFIGPHAEAMLAFGNKAKARKIAEELNVPIVPGYHGENQDRAFLLEKAKEIGYPIMIKTTGGGGGTGNRMVTHEEEARKILTGIFKDQEVILEKFLKDAIHIEVQVAIDEQEEINLGGRDCSSQRKNQKNVEVAPADTPYLAIINDFTQRMAKEQRHRGFRGVATHEFLLADGKVFYNECNTRLQVEHKPTEDILGNRIHLIDLQLYIAAGKTIRKYLNQQLPEAANLATSQDMIYFARQISPIKVSVEVRINAEEYLGYEGKLINGPAIGKVEAYTPPTTSNANGKQIGNIESSIEANMAIDTSMVNANIILLCGWGKDLNEAMTNVQTLLSRLHIKGIPTNCDYLKFAVDYLQKMSQAGLNYHVETSKQIDALYYETRLAIAKNENQYGLKAL